jgi:hypothetical protein
MSEYDILSNYGLVDRFVALLKMQEPEVWHVRAAILARMNQQLEVSQKSKDFLIELIKELEYIQGSMRGSIGGINNAYLPQIRRDYFDSLVEKLRVFSREYSKPTQLVNEHRDDAKEYISKNVLLHPEAKEAEHEEVELTEGIIQEGDVLHLINGQEFNITPVFWGYNVSILSKYYFEGYKVTRRVPRKSAAERKLEIAIRVLEELKNHPPIYGVYGVGFIYQIPNKALAEIAAVDKE